MLGGLLSLLSVVLGWFGFGKPDPEAQGVTSGLAQAAAANAIQELANAKKANDAAAAVSNDPDSVRNDPNNRDNPNYRGG